MATRSAIADFSGFCDRNPQACATGSTAVQVFASKVRYGADLLTSYLHHDQAPDSGTLKSEDMEPTWRGLPTENGSA